MDINALSSISGSNMKPAWRKADPMIKTILILADQTTAFETALASGIELANRFGAHLDVLHVRADPVGVVPLAAEGLPPSVIEEIRNMAEKTSKEHELKARATYDRLCASSGVSASWRIATGRKADIAAAAARLNDLVLVGRSTSDDPSWRDEIESILFNGARPILLLPRDSQPFLGKRAAVAWNGSAQAARAVTAALPFLRLARGTDILSAGAIDIYASTAGLIAYLSRHEVDATAREFNTSDAAIGKMLLEQCRLWDDQLLVMGAYGRSRLRELILGGVTKEVLTDSDLPILICR
jgi:nucleotide-binding universal stress UspA family protein